MRRLLVFFLAALILVGVGAAVGFVFSSRNPPPRAAEVQVVTVPVLVTATRDPNATEAVRVVTATPLPGSVGVLPTGILETADAPTRDAPTLDPEILGADAALQQTVTALPDNCILHTVGEGDTPFGIAETYGADGFAIMEVNGLTEETATQIQIGDVLIVPLEGCPLTAADVAAQSAETDEEAAAETTVEATEEATESAEATRTPTVVPTITLPPTAANAQVEIVRVISAGDITAEGVEIRNLGGVVDLTGWTLRDSQGNEFVFPEQRLFTNGLVTVYSRVGQNTPIALYWGRSEAVWGDPDDTITLLNGSDAVQSTLRLNGN